jgi:hypothetical protein
MGKEVVRCHEVDVVDTTVGDHAGYGIQKLGLGDVPAHAAARDLIVLAKRAL